MIFYLRCGLNGFQILGMSFEFKLFHEGCITWHETLEDMKILNCLSSPAVSQNSLLGCSALPMGSSGFINGGVCEVLTGGIMFRASCLFRT